MQTQPNPKQPLEELSLAEQEALSTKLSSEFFSTGVLLYLSTFLGAGCYYLHLSTLTLVFAVAAVYFMFRLFYVTDQLDESIRKQAALAESQEVESQDSSTA